MTIPARFATVVLLLAAVFCAQSTSAGESLGPGYIGTLPFWSGDYPYYEGPYPPNPLYAPYGFYGCRGGCCRQAVWRGQHWHNVISCASVRGARTNAAVGPRYLK
jgi:hypothetical protein